MNFHRRQPARIRLNLTPMIDVVFLLIIFFMVVSQYSSQERSILDLPEAKDSDLQRAADPKKSIIVNVHPDGNVSVDDINYDLDDLAALLRTNVDEKIIIRSDKSCQWHLVKPVFNACRLAGIATPNIAVIQE